MFLLRLADGNMADEASETYAGSIRAILGTVGFLVMMFGGYFLYEGKGTGTGVLLLCLGPLFFLAAAAWKTAQTRLLPAIRIHLTQFILGAVALSGAILVIAAIVGFVTMPSSAPISAAPATQGAAPTAVSPAPSKKIRTQREIAELQSESGALLEIIQETAKPLVEEWREAITTQNPEQICRGLDSRSLQDKISNISARLKAASGPLAAIFEQNKIDRDELAPLLGAIIPHVQPTHYFGKAGTALDGYLAGVKALGDHPTCEEVVNKDVPKMFHVMMVEFDQFRIWVSNSEGSLLNYREALRKEARSAP